VAFAGGAWMMFGRGESNARSRADVEAMVPILKNLGTAGILKPAQPLQPAPATATATEPAAAPISPAPESPPSPVVATAAHTTRKRHESAHAAKPSGAPPVVAANPVAAASPPATATPPAPPSAPKGALAEGDGLFRGGDVEGALAKYQEAARANPSDAKAQKMIGKCYNRLGQHDRAVPYLKKYLELSPDASDKAFIQAQIDQK
jgi:hypothetical protein